MKTLLTSKTGVIHELNCDITIFSDKFCFLPVKYKTIILDNIHTKHCAIIKDDDTFKIIDFCSTNTQLFRKQDVHPQPLKPLKFYELRDSDTIFIGDHELLFHQEPDENDKRSFYIPETQEVEHNNRFQDTVITEDIEIPETQELTQDIELPSPPKRKSLIEPESARLLKIAVERDRSEFFVETQPLQFALPPNTRRYAAKQNEIKPKTVPLSVFDCDSQKLNAETQAMTLTQLLKSKKPMKSNRKRKLEPPKIVRNSVLNSETESDSDDERCSRISAVSVEPVEQNTIEIDDSISQMSEFDDCFKVEFDSQFIEQVNSSCEVENLPVNSETVKEEDSQESDSNPVKQESENKIKPGSSKRIKLFRFASSDED